MQVMDAFYDVMERFFPDDPDKQTEVSLLMAAFRSKDGPRWKRPFLAAAARKLPAHQ